MQYSQMIASELESIAHKLRAKKIRHQKDPKRYPDLTFAETKKLDTVTNLAREKDPVGRIFGKITV